MQVWQNWPRQPITNKNLAQQKPTYSITLLRVIPTMASNPNIQVKLWCNVLAWSSKSLAFFLTLVGKQFYLDVLPNHNKAHMYKPNSQLNSSKRSHAMCPFILQFKRHSIWHSIWHSISDIWSGIPSDILFGIFSGILISHSYLTFFLRFF